MNLHKCILCKEEKEQNNTNFYWRKCRNKWHTMCIQCWNNRGKKYHHENKEKINKRKSQYIKENKEKRNIYLKKYREIHKTRINKYIKEYNIENNDKIKQRLSCYYKKNIENISKKHRKYYEENKEVINKRHKKYSEKNKEKIKLYSKKYNAIDKNKERRKKREMKWAKARRLIDSAYKLRKNISSSVGAFIKRRGLLKKSSITKHLNIIEIKKYLELQFEPWMNWSNWGKYVADKWDDNDSSTWVWQIDHIVPQASLPYDSMVHPNFKKCWALENLRPLSAKQNVLDGISRIRHIQQE